MINEIDIFGRHTVRADGSCGKGKLEEGDLPSEKYPSITNAGERKAREAARKEYAEIINAMEQNGILFLGGSSEEPRTKATAEIIGEELSDLYKNKEEILVIDKAMVGKMKEEIKDGNGKILEKIKSAIEKNVDKKIIIAYPLFLKEFSLRPSFRDQKTGEHTEFSKEVLSKVNYDEQKGFLEWLENQGEIDKNGKIIKGISPQEAAEKHLEGMSRLRNFAKSIVGERQICAGFIGHGWNLDALALYFANGGKVEKEAFKSLFDNEIIKQAETGWVEMKNNKTVLHYKDQKIEN